MRAIAAILVLLVFFFLASCQANVVLRHLGEPKNPKGALETGHSFIFVGGLHRTGTTLVTYMLGTHPNVTGILDAPRHQNEGQHLQNTYPSDGQVEFQALDPDPKVACGVSKDMFPKPRGPVFFRGKFNHVLFASAGEAHLTEATPLVNQMNAEKLLGSWRKHWDMRRHFLLEKTPANLIRARFFQALYGPDSTHFVMTVRHPLTAVPALPDCNQFADVEKYIQQFVLALRVYLPEDLPFVRNVLLLRFEDLLSNPNDVSRMLFEGLGLSDFQPPLSSRPNQPLFPILPGRLPLNFHGRFSKNDVTLSESSRDNWVGNWKRMEAQCAGMADRFVAKYEEHIRPFGYSFRAPYILPTNLTDAFPALRPSYGYWDEQTERTVWTPAQSSLHERLAYKKFISWLETCEQ